ncbi:hypothetical protein [Cellulosimicrobium sp. CUA-896]|uniref:hypothetical protein n=1 Tax=Cellulosimicrobium sp. CUA-896 TaxID=1517881 RepID=UPI0035171A40
MAYAGLSTDLSVGTATQVAGRDAYQLGLVPRTDGTLVERVLVAVDAETSTPLRVQVWSTQDARTPALEIGFTDVSFEAPDGGVLDFSAPAGASTREVEVPLPDPADHRPGRADALTAVPEGVSVSGTGWETVVAVDGVDVAGLLAGDPASAAALPGVERSFGSAGARTSTASSSARTAPPVCRRSTPRGSTTSSRRRCRRVVCCPRRCCRCS